MLKNMMHHVTKGTPTGAGGLRRFAAGVGGNFDVTEDGEWLRGWFDSHTRGRPFHSQSAEQAVSAVQAAVQYESS